MLKQLVRLPQVKQTVGYSRSEIYRLIALNRFPKPIRIGDRAVAWDSDEIQLWINDRIKASSQDASGSQT
jgi:prophage regulatory protein